MERGEFLKTVLENFGNPAITMTVTRGFASCPHEQFAVIGFKRTGENLDKTILTTRNIVKVNSAKL